MTRAEAVILVLFLGVEELEKEGIENELVSCGELFKGQCFASRNTALF